MGDKKIDLYSYYINISRRKKRNIQIIIINYKIYIKSYKNTKMLQRIIGKGNYIHVVGVE